MNTSLLNTSIQKFITKHINSNITTLILKGSPFSEVTIQEVCEQIEAKKRCQTKLSLWFDTANIYYPNRLNIEQTSSEITANYKSKLVSGNTLVDTTGGFGVDTYYFSKAIKKVTHCELDSKLSSLVKHNYTQLKRTNIQCIQTNGIAFIINNNNHYNWIYSDPSRRNDLKGKVFLLEDCLPNIPKHLEGLFEKSDNILLKISPILDITSAIRELHFVKEIHIVAIQNEVKELLFILEKGHTKEVKLVTINITKTEEQHFQFTYQSETQALYGEPKTYLFEPNSAILKSGGFNNISARFKIAKLHQHSHLYTSEELIKFPGRRFRILSQTTYHRKKLHALIPNKKANITTRNFPETVAQIRKKTGLKDGGDTYLFFTTNIKNQRIVLICTKI